MVVGQVGGNGMTVVELVAEEEEQEIAFAITHSMEDANAKAKMINLKGVTQEAVLWMAAGVLMVAGVLVADLVVEASKVKQEFALILRMEAEIAMDNKSKKGNAIHMLVKRKVPKSVGLNVVREFIKQRGEKVSM